MKKSEALAKIALDYPAFCLSAFVKGYLDAAFFTEEESLSKDAGTSPHELELSPGAEEHARASCLGFLLCCIEFGVSQEQLPSYSENLGNDLWFTRNGHGVGFWEVETEVAKIFDGIAKGMGPAYLYIGDDGKLHF